MKKHKKLAKSINELKTRGAPMPRGTVLFNEKDKQRRRGSFKQESKRIIEDSYPSK